MMCPNKGCGTKLEITHVYSAGDFAETRNMKCPKCGLLESSMTFMLRRPDFARKVGMGALALRKKILRGEIDYTTTSGDNQDV